MTSTPDNLYFILTKKPEHPKHVNLGRICYISKYKHSSQLRIYKCPKNLPVFFIGAHSAIDYDIELDHMDELSAEEAELLQALSDDADRLKWFRQRDALQTALTLTEDTEVMVEEEGKRLRGIIRFIGRIKSPSYGIPLPGTFFGIELQGDDRGKGRNDGKFEYKRFFSCELDCGVFAPFSTVRPLGASPPTSPISPTPPAPCALQPAAQEPTEGSHTEGSQTEELHPADRVSYFIGGKIRQGMVVDVQEKHGQHVVRISTDTDENGKRGGEVVVPLQDVFKGEIPTAPESMQVDTPAVETTSEDLWKDPGLSLNSLVEVNLGSGNLHGIIRWIGKLQERQETMAGLELEDERGVSDGTFKNARLFSCPMKRALFVKLSSCRPDSRFQTAAVDNCHGMDMAEDHYGSTDEPDSDLYRAQLKPVPPISTEQIKDLLLGRMKGIQGHCNSCYMDAALFSLFSCSSVLDSMLFKSTTPEDAPIQRTLLYDIVNPLRSKGFVEGRHVMKLRQQLQKHGYSHSFTTDEKDPEEFLTVIMHHILALDPLLKLSALGKVQESYCYQIFLEQSHSLVLPTVQQLLEHSFHCAGLKLAEVPSCLILQMPRFGKKFKMFDKIIPSLELDISDLLSEGPQQCMLCGQLAERECEECFGDPVFSQRGFKVFCGRCSEQVHSHPDRRAHQPSRLSVPRSFAAGSAQPLTRDRLELFAVLCIETSHYVSFIKHGPHSHDWIFFDSMADRQGERDGFNIPEVQACPEVGVYLDMSPSELANQVPREMKGVAKRLFCDAYMYLYKSPNMCLYR